MRVIRVKMRLQSAIPIKIGPLATQRRCAFNCGVLCPTGLAVHRRTPLDIHAGIFALQKAKLLAQSGLRTPINFPERFGEPCSEIAIRMDMTRKILHTNGFVMVIRLLG